MTLRHRLATCRRENYTPDNNELINPLIIGNLLLKPSISGYVTHIKCRWHFLRAENTCFWKNSFATHFNKQGGWFITYRLWTTLVYISKCFGCNAVIYWQFESREFQFHDIKSNLSYVFTHCVAQGIHICVKNIHNKLLTRNPSFWISNECKVDPRRPHTAATQSNTNSDQLSHSPLQHMYWRFPSEGYFSNCV